MTVDPIEGCIVGTAVGDAMGLPYEGLSRRRAQALLGPPDRHRFFFGRGMVSDDTEHTIMAARSMVIAAGDPDRFARIMAWHLRIWLLLIPAGVGFATLRSIVRLWIGFNPCSSGVYSAGNGPAMRAAVIGASIQDITLMKRFIAASTRLTHMDPKAEYGALTVALAARAASDHQEMTVPERFLNELRSQLPAEARELTALIARVVESVKRGETTETFAVELGYASGVAGYIYATVPVVIHAWLSNPREIRKAVVSVIRCGGDTDTTAAMVGGIVGCAVGKQGIPQEWIERLWFWPWSWSQVESISRQLGSASPKETAWRQNNLRLGALWLRNMGFLIVVLWHGFRRLAPPY